MAERIANKLRKAADAYYNTGKAIMTDDEFDRLKDELAEIAPQHPFLQQVGAPAKGGVKVELPYWMGSLDKIRDDDKALAKWTAKYPGAYVVSDKLDGISALIAGGRMYTRGDGTIGQDITHIMPMLGKGIPADLSADTAVRGELIISKANWEKIKHMGANARNMVSGLVNAKNPDTAVAKQVEFVAYELLHPKSASPSASVKVMRDIGFNVVHNEVVKDLTVSGLSTVLMNRRKNSPFECDGIVVMHDENHRSVKGKNPTYGFAFKSIATHEEADVVVTEVTWNASKDGYLKPLVHFDPVVIAGVTIAKATGFNAQFIENNKIGPGARIVIIRSGDVIPHILRVVASADTSFPKDVKWEWNATHVDIVVASSENDGDVTLKRMVHFCKILGVKNVAEGTLKRMFDVGINTITKLLRVTVADLLKIDGFKDKSAERIVAGLAVIRDVPCGRLMAASNIFGRGLGEKKLDLILAEFPYGSALDAASEDDIAKINGIGPVTATSFIAALPEFRRFVGDTNLKSSCLQDKPAPPQACNKFAGMTIVFTGFRNKEWEAQITAQGGKVSTTVSKNTTLIVAADPTEESTKLAKARDLGINVISKDEFVAIRDNV